MASVYFVSVDQVEQYELFQSNHDYFVLAMLFLLVLVIIVGASFSLFEKQIALKKQDVDRLSVEIVNLSTHDQLTQLPNRLFVEDRIGEILQQHRTDNQQLAFLYIDLDRFRMVNEIYGHKMADQLFIEVVKRVKQTLWRNVRLARFGSDELVMMVSNATGEEAKALAKQVNAKIKRNYRIGDQTIALSASIGVAMFPEHGNSFKELVMNADLAMLQAKAQGGNGFYYFDETLEAQRVRQEYNLINDLTTAIIHDQLVLHYQPKYNANLQRCGVEALIRWQHPKLGLLTPHRFIDLAEKSGLIVAIGHWVLEQACKQIQLWQTSDFPLVPIAINFSASQFEHDELFEVLDELLEKYQIDAKYLIIEVTETTAMRNVKLCVQKFERLRQIGLQIAIDDFGTGYSSFSYLKDLPIDELKIDKVFVSHLDGENKKDEIILASIINLASQLGLIVTAEGVETEQQAEILIRLGCHQMQGYYFAKPMPIEDLAHSKFDLQKV
jgi:diguanylate cyclase (GGDEF)-like protein